MIHKFNFVIQVIVSTLVIASAVNPAHALPGENIVNVLEWVKTKPQLPTLEYSSETLTYFGKKGNLQFFISEYPTDDFSYLYPPSSYIHSETIEISKEPQIKFSQKTDQAIQLVKDIYNTKIANDYRRSQYGAKINGMTFYKGKLFAYITIDSKDNSSWEIIHLNSWQQEIDNAKLSSFILKPNMG
ncbi:hypothetical protein H6G06_04475 [Anabaena sphaerica FACHB-251]|uniref:Uncharacterized protein n=1 Tax=Anabaena sphaerica FACHB-251 TaxID=2692883 RepID=A0A926WE28_9NOST|nr:hypothetical protein [Anabaena sphaerica]MBD2292758.1 hypothetical protein [Anabaena sphaerica FACHB-251]